jgi:hypothetical protein
MFKGLYEYLNAKARYRDLIYLSHFKAFGMTNLQYEIRIPQKIYNRATIIENYWNRL